MVLTLVMYQCAGLSRRGQLLDAGAMSACPTVGTLQHRTPKNATALLD
jgi:hypothetical protein